MYTMLVRLMVIAALADLFGGDRHESPSKQGETKITHRLSKDVVRIDWKPISVFPEHQVRAKK